MRLHLRKFAFVFIVSAFVTACSKDDDSSLPASPTINVTEIGSDNSKIGYAGSDLHVDADVVAPGGIANIQVEIHGEANGAWQFDSVYTDGLAGLKNAEFHKHIDIPENASPGEYHIHFTVTDQSGQKAEFEDHLEIRVDPSLPTAEGFEIGLGDNAEDLHVEADITAVNGISKVIVEIHGPWETEVEFTDANMVGQTSYHFHKHIDISEAPAGHYHVHLKVVDEAGKEREFEDHFDK